MTVTWTIGHNVASYLPDDLTDQPLYDELAEAVDRFVDHARDYADAHDDALHASADEPVETEDLMRPSVDAIVAELGDQLTTVTEATRGFTFWVYDVDRRLVTFWIHGVDA